MALYLIANGPMQTEAAFAAVTTGTAIKTMLQVKPSATIAAKIRVGYLVRWLRCGTARQGGTDRNGHYSHCDGTRNSRHHEAGRERLVGWRPGNKPDSGRHSSDRLYSHRRKPSNDHCDSTQPGRTAIHCPDRSVHQAIPAGPRASHSDQQVCAYPRDVRHCG